MRWARSSTAGSARSSPRRLREGLLEPRRSPGNARGAARPVGRSQARDVDRAWRRAIASQSAPLGCSAMRGAAYSGAPHPQFLTTQRAKPIWSLSQSVRLSEKFVAQRTWVTSNVAPRPGLPSEYMMRCNGHAVAAYDTVLTYCKQRKQFGNPLVSFQLIQDRLVRMLAEVTGMQLYCMQIARLEESGRPRNDRRPGEAQQHTQGALAHRRGARPCWAATGFCWRTTSYATCGDIEVIHTFGRHRDDAGAERRARHHRRRRLHVGGGVAIVQRLPPVPATALTPRPAPRGAGQASGARPGRRSRSRASARRPRPCPRARGRRRR